ncbi:hypothetical protein ABZY09_43385 [Streptomyces sp. NPDC002928]|uniref:hypothetical protein n=1 Tax=Streptomyces sp. NPDC002928 TaxID=3154440 RepID=UPI0033AAE1AC
MTADVRARQVSTVMHVRCPDRLPEELYRQVLELLADISPVVKALPPSAGLVQLRGALRYHGTGSRRLGEMLRVRSVSRLGVDVRVGIGESITVVATASAQIAGSGGVLAVDAAHTVDWLAQLPVDALHGIGPRQAAVLREYGIHYVGALAAVPSAAVQRLLGGSAGGSLPTGPGASTRAPSSPAPCPSPRPSATASTGTSWTAPKYGPPCWSWWFASGTCCAGAARPPER